MPKASGMLCSFVSPFHCATQQAYGQSSSQDLTLYSTAGLYAGRAERAFSQRSMAGEMQKHSSEKCGCHKRSYSWLKPLQECEFNTAALWPCDQGFDQVLAHESTMSRCMARIKRVCGMEDCRMSRESFIRN